MTLNITQSGLPDCPFCKKPVTVTRFCGMTKVSCPQGFDGECHGPFIAHVNEQTAFIDWINYCNKFEVGK